MKLFSPVQPRRVIPAPLEVPGWEGLEVLPYRRTRLVFAHLAAQLAQERDYDRVLVDLPQFMNDSEWLEIPLQILPAVSLAVFRRQDGGLRAMPLAPNDAPVAALFMARLKSRPWRCIDDSDLLHYPPGAVFAPAAAAGDDLRVWQQGLEGYFRPLWEQLDRAWEGVGGMAAFFTDYRAQKVAAEVRREHRAGEKTLLVCEYQLWWRLRWALQEGRSPAATYLFKWQDAPGVLRVEDPYFAWRHGLLDDYPAVTLAFWRGLKQGSVGGFDKIQAFERLLGEFFLGRANPAQEEPPEDGKVISLLPYFKKLGKQLRPCPPTRPASTPWPISLRRLLAFATYLRQLTWLQQRLLPEPGTQFFHAAQACGDRSLHQELAKKFLEYPETLSRSQINLILQQGGIIVGGGGLDLPDYEHLPSFFTGMPFSSWGAWEGWDLEAEEREARGRTLEVCQPRLTPAEERELEDEPEGTYIRWEVSEDFQVQAQACRQIRYLVAQAQQQCVPKKSWGSLAEGVHWKATLAGWARGEPGLYVKCRSRSQKQGFSLDVHTPVAFLLAPEEEIDHSSGMCIFDQNEAQRSLDLGTRRPRQFQDQDPDQVFSVFLTSRRKLYLWDEHVQQEDLTSLTTLYSKAAMGLDRYYAITRLPARYQCRRHPNADLELLEFPLSQRGIAWALKYALEVVIVAARAGWQPSRELKEFARQHGKRLVTVDLARFRPDFLGRLSRIFLLSTKLKRHPRHAEIARRFIY